MALGFIKKVFTFGRERPAEEQAPAEDLARVEAPVVEQEAEVSPASEFVEPASPPSVPSGHLPHKGGERLEDAAPVQKDQQPAEQEEVVVSHEVEASELAADNDVDALPEPISGTEADVTSEETTVEPISPLVGEMSDGTEGGDEGAADTDLTSKDSDTAPNLPKGFSTSAPEPIPEAPKQKLSWFQRLRAGLARTSSQLSGQIAALFTKRKLDDQTLQDLEDLLIQADLGVETAMRVTDTLASERYGKDVTGEDVGRIMAQEIAKVLKPVAKPLQLDLSHKPHVILVVGVNGTGKTTTIGKLAAKLSGAGLKVMVAAGDTFRAAAIEQLKIWADRTKSEFIGTKLGADAAGLAFDAFQQAKANKSDVLIIDTAGRLQNKAELMAELEKIVRVLGKLDPDAPHTVLQTLDATTGQNALNQVEIFRNVAGVNGLIMTKLDGTARGGILVAISAKHKLPVYFIGVGEGVDDLEPFEAEDFAHAIAGTGAVSSQ
ncbi:MULTISPECIES: signal recognition particle-docking protein FtsY [Rhizobium]|uniref:Signal recognition particle receptor FtsY n=1 Tax=Rhizobium tropici TaxID=398 RepID=A0A6P1C0A6_RHITR|nr:MULTISPECIES: signal recognition particle-docking protein FtsY [Rhizobium]AGB72789.1 cell division protein FtsY [Rhizobium tropici CIAT 899]MBB4241084.1 fused signal recognition particle receptor [Rhizobium tropici]MBB5592369.1 fused signal recognition particle receptor [Rhizobium tropici]MBB6491409.1 fused signal recognition particle receptor [Rhizobium tropici]NEV10540.1 signal recognition particle-docking protein FtsY [Rhizobium tropici]